MFCFFLGKFLSENESCVLIYRYCCHCFFGGIYFVLPFPFWLLLNIPGILYVMIVAVVVQQGGQHVGSPSFFSLWPKLFLFMRADTNSQVAMPSKQHGYSRTIESRYCHLTCGNENAFVQSSFPGQRSGFSKHRRPKNSIGPKAALRKNVRFAPCNFATSHFPALRL